MITLKNIASALGGEVNRDQVAAPGPGHGPKDRSLNIKLADSEPGFIVYSHAGDDAIACKDYVREKLGLPAFKPNGKSNGRHTYSRASEDTIAAALTAAVAATARPASTPTGTFVTAYDYVDADGALLYQVVRYKEPKSFKQRRPNGSAWIWKLEDRRVLYRLPELLKYPEATVFFTEGEKDADRVASLGHCATTIASGKWNDECSTALVGRDVLILQDNDKTKGLQRAMEAATALHGRAKSVRVICLPGAKDVSDWLDLDPGNAGKLVDVCFDTPLWDPAQAITAADGSDAAISLDDFYAYMPMHNYIFVPTLDTWPGSSINARIPPIACGDKYLKASDWLDKFRPVEQMTWIPGEPMVISGRFFADGGFIKRSGITVFNQYREPIIKHGDVSEADPWVEHTHRVFGDDASHIIQWLAHRVQRPFEKINHALVLGGMQGIGKDTTLEPIKHAIGPWNFTEVSPQHMLARFNGFLKSVILRVSEARDLGEFDRFKFYDHSKAYIAAPPDVLRIDKKHLHEYSIPNVSGVIITTNHKTDGIFLPADDRRHFVAWSELNKESFEPEYWTRLWRWYSHGGNGHVAAYLANLDLSGFDPKAPPHKTSAFWEIVDASRAPEDGEMQDAIDRLGAPNVLTLYQIISQADADFALYLKDRKNARRIPHRLEACGYVAVRDEGTKDGRWKVHGRNQTVYGKSSLPLRDRFAAAKAFSTKESW
jgi:hypothetical protein